MPKLISTKTYRNLIEENARLKDRLTEVNLLIGVKHGIEIVDLPQRVIPARTVARKVRK